MAERLTSGAMPPDWKPPPEPPAEPSRWFETGMPGGGRVDPSEYDSPPGLYETPAAPPRADVRTALEYQRAAAANGSPYVFRMASCVGCGTALTYYGRADHAPAEPRCHQCKPTEQEPPPMT